MFGAPKSTAGEHGVTASDVSSVPSITGAVSTFLSDPNRGGGTVPKAYINYIFFDEQFRYAGGGFSRVGSNHASDLSNIVVPKNGYLYVYVSNESPVAVFFDNLQVVHSRGPILEETHYYPFGLTMQGISSKAAAFGVAENKYKFNNGTELNSDFDVSFYETNFRSLDPQLGRFCQIDPAADIASEISPFAYANNNPLTYNDPLGLFNDTTGNNPTPMPEVRVSAKAQVPAQFIPYLHFTNSEPFRVANSMERPLALDNHKGSVLKDYLIGSGATNRVYPAWHHMTKRLMNAEQVRKARINFYKKHYTDFKNGLSLKGVHEHSNSDFGLMGLLGAGLDMVEQYVGGMEVDIYVDEKEENLLYVISNTTGRYSQYYHAAKDIERVPGHATPEGNLYQRYIWSEPIKPGFESMKSSSQWDDLIQNARIK